MSEQTAATRYSPDGRWWWDGTEWRPALSPDGLWRWDGERWVPAQAPPVVTPARGGGGAAGLTLGILGGCAVLLALVAIVVVVLMLTMGGQIQNVFSNVTVALQSP
ncbi:MAG TPA: hypothetical protein VK131_14015 [Candidatus Acidoferrales bacterium]|nr:hypothetical protein [Candidatus Acidoferrales bacterium]